MDLAVLVPQNPIFPDPNSALEDPDGLLAVGGNLQPDTLLSAYYQGIFPWYNEDDPILWWSPSTRCVIEPNNLHISKSLQKQLRQQKFKVTFNRSFEQVITACAERDFQTDTWINKDMILAYTNLNKLGKAHSVEIWQNEELVGGAYGLSIGAIFCGESMFSRQTNASKIALVYLCRHIAKLGFKLIDCQLETEHLVSMGAKAIKRKTFLTMLHQLRDSDIKWNPEGYIPTPSD